MAYGGSLSEIYRASSRKAFLTYHNSLVALWLVICDYKGRWNGSSRLVEPIRILDDEVEGIMGFESIKKRSARRLIISVCSMRVSPKY
jgi:hypothetical protein